MFIELLEGQAKIDITSTVEAIEIELDNKYIEAIKKKGKIFFYSKDGNDVAYFVKEEIKKYGK